MKTTKLLIVGVLLFSLVRLYGQQESIVNGVSWYDTSGNRIQAHGASILKHNGKYYMLGASEINGFYTVQFNLYSSTDLTNWTFLNTVVDKDANQQLMNGERIALRPNLVYNAMTDKFVIWATYKDKSLQIGEVGVFVSDKVDGDYAFVKSFHPLNYDSNDSGMFVDDDGTAYFVSNSKDTKALNLYELTEDYMDIKGSPTVLFPGKNVGREAPVLFKRGDTYYLMSSAKSGWDPNAGKYATSSTLTSGWSALKNFGNRITFDTQPTQVVSVSGNSDTSYFYLGDRWKDPDLRESKNILLPLTFDEDGNMSMEYVPEYNIDIGEGTWQQSDENTYVPHGDWRLISVSSEQNPDQFGAKNLFDDNLNTIWNTNFKNGTDDYPYEVVIDLGSDYDVTGFMLVPRQDYNPNVISDFQLFLSSNGSDWGKPVASGRISYWGSVRFPEYSSAHYLKFVARGELSGSRFASASELRLMNGVCNYDNKKIQPYYNLNETGWQTGTEVELREGGSIQFGPQAETDDGGQTQFYGSWSWYGPNGYYAEGRAQTIMDIQPEQFGEYTVYYLDDRFNLHRKTITLISEENMGVNDFQSTAPKFILYPNPANSIVQIMQANEQTHYRVTDLNGKEIMNNKGSRIDVSGLSKGLYFLKIRSEHRTVVKKLIVN